MALSAYAVTTPGLEHLACTELRALGVTPAEPERGGVAFDATEASLAAALISLRTVTRVLVRAAEFRATSFAQLEQRARALPWSRWVRGGGHARFRVTCRKSRLYHSDAVAQRLAGALTNAVQGVRISRGATDEEDEEDAAQLFVVRLADNVCTVSVDASGAPLYRRGYRLAIAKAPLRETLAAAIVLGAGWSGSTALCDPLCGSGTIPIEGALIARHIAPGLGRAYAAEQWPSTRASVWTDARDAARAAVLLHAIAPIIGSDRDEGAVVAARANAERAGVQNDVTFAHLPVSAATAPAPRGLLATNPPYGIRVGEAAPLRDLYARLGHVAREAFSGWDFALLSGDQTRGRTLERQLALPLEPLWETTNGGIPVRLLVARP